jgi:hypothetical protein
MQGCLKNPINRRRRVALAVFGFIAVLISSGVVWASMFGEENLALAALLEQAVEHVKLATQAVEKMEKAAEQGTAMVDQSRKVVEAVEFGNKVFHNPDPLRQYARKQWEKTHPQSVRLQSSAKKFGLVFDRTRHPNGNYDYPPEDFLIHVETVKQTGVQAYETMIRLFDKAKINDPHDAAVAQLQVQNKDVNDSLEDLNNALKDRQVSMAESAAHAARNTGLGALAQQQSAALLEQLVRDQQTTLFETAQRNAQDRAARRDQNKAARTVRQASWRLDPSEATNR